MLYSYLIYFLLIPISLPIIQRRNVDWCAYWRALQQDHLRPECNGIYRIRFAKKRDIISRPMPALMRDLVPSYNRYKQERSSMTSFTKQVLGIQTCTVLYNDCKESSLCDSRLICLSSLQGYCCASFHWTNSIQHCPNPATLTERCNPGSTVTWCLNDKHCSIGHCCPTQCGYNICVQKK